MKRVTKNTKRALTSSRRFILLIFAQTISELIQHALCLQRFVDFTAKAEIYTIHFVAVELRKLFAETFRVVATAPQPRLENSGLSGFEAIVYEVSTVKAEAKVDKAGFIKALQLWRVALSSIDPDKYFVPGLAVLAAIANLTPDDHFESVKAIHSKASSDSWSPDDYKESFAKTPELNELTNTPFMLQVRLYVKNLDIFLLIVKTNAQIIAQILPTLGAKKVDTRLIKSVLVLTLGEFIAELVWANLNADGGLLTDLSNFQKALEAKSESADDRQAQRNKVSKSAAAVVKVIRESPEKWDQVKIPENIPEEHFWEQVRLLNSDESCPELKQLTSVVDHEILRALRRPLTRRAQIYDLFIEFYIDRVRTRLYALLLH